MRRGRLWGLALYLFVLGFILNLLGIVSHVVVSASPSAGSARRCRRC
jgi:hypothetical protein